LVRAWTFLTSILGAAYIQMSNEGFDERKSLVAKAALRVFFEKGYKTASLQQVAEEADICKATVYHYFKTKEEILYYIIEKNTEVHLAELKEHLKECRRKKMTPLEIFRELMTKYALALNKDKETPLLILRERHQLTGEYRTKLHNIEQAIFRFIREELGKVPDIEERFDPNVICFLLISSSHWMKYWLKEDGELAIEDAITQVLDIVLDGMLKK
jgi:AcrR family transcriptional regulator